MLVFTEILKTCTCEAMRELKALLYIFFWVFPRRQIVVGRRFGTLCQFHLQRLDVDCQALLFTNVHLVCCIAYRSST